MYVITNVLRFKSLLAHSKLSSSTTKSNIHITKSKPHLDLTDMLSVIQHFQHPTPWQSTSYSSGYFKYNLLFLSNRFTCHVLTHYKKYLKTRIHDYDGSWSHSAIAALHANYPNTNVLLLGDINDMLTNHNVTLF